MTPREMRAWIAGKLDPIETYDPAKRIIHSDFDLNPTEAELIHELQMAVDLFRPSFDEEQGHDIANNCRRLWPLIYGREIDPRKEIIAPALAIRKAGYGEPTRDYKQELRDALREEKTRL